VDNEWGKWRRFELDDDAMAVDKILKDLGVIHEVKHHAWGGMSIRVSLAYDNYLENLIIQEGYSATKSG
jgi:hypothetical protein